MVKYGNYCVLLSSVFVTLHGEIQTYTMVERCGSTIDLERDGVYSGLLIFDLPAMTPSGSCNCTLKSPHKMPYFLFYFTQMSLIQCTANSLEILVSSVVTAGPTSYPGISSAICGSTSSLINTVYETDNRFLTLRMYWSSSFQSVTKSISFTLFFNTYHQLTTCSDFQCDNGRCIDNSATCNGYDPCGDNSDCNSGGDNSAAIDTITGSVYGGVSFGVFVVFCIIICCCFFKDTSGGLRDMVGRVCDRCGQCLDCIGGCLRTGTSSCRHCCHRCRTASTSCRDGCRVRCDQLSSRCHLTWTACRNCWKPNEEAGTEQRGSSETPPTTAPTAPPLDTEMIDIVTRGGTEDEPPPYSPMSSSNADRDRPPSYQSVMSNPDTYKATKT